MKRCSLLVDNATAMRQIKAVLAAARSACADDKEQLGAMVGAIATFCAQRRGAAQLFDLAIETLTRAKVEMETGVPALDPQEPS